VGLWTLWLIFRFTRQHFGRPVAVLATALISTDPSFVHTIRLDYGPVALAHLFKMGGLCLLSRWLAGGSRLALAGGMFLFGLGLWDKAIFAWFLAGLGAAVLLLFPRETWARIRSSPVAAGLAAAALLAGAAPLLIFNVASRGLTWQERGQFEIRWFKLVQARVTMDGRYMMGVTGEEQLEAAPPADSVRFPRLAGWMHSAGRLRRTALLPLLGLALALLPLNLFLGSRRTLLFPLLFSVLAYACMFLTFDGGASAHHLIMLQPFPMIFLAASLWAPARRWPRKPLQAAAVAYVVAAVAVNLSLNARHLAIYTRTGGTGAFTDAVYRLAPYLGERPQRKIYTLDWALGYPLVFAGSRWNLVPEEILGDFPAYVPDREQLAGLMRDPESVFVLHSPQRNYFPGPARQFFSLADSGIAMRQVAFFKERSGEIVYEVYRGGGGEIRPEEPEVSVHFLPDRVAPGQDYVIQVREFPNAWLDLVIHVDQISSAAVERFCRLDGEGRARLTVPADHPAATVRVTLVRPAGGSWRPARGSVTVVR